MEKKEGLLRRLSFWQIWAIGVGAVIGDGIFLLIGQGASEGGPVAILSYLAAGVLFLVVMMALAELAVGMPTAGSFYVWGRRMLGPGYGFMASTGYIAMNFIFLGSVSLAIGAISNWYFQWTANPYTSAIIWALIWLTVVVGIVLAGVVITGRAQLALVGILCSIMVIFAISGIASGRMEAVNFIPFMPYGLAGALAALGMGAYAYMGPLTLLTTAGECKKVTDLPKALFWACMTFLIVYALAQIVLLGLVRYTELGVMESPFTYAAMQIWGGAAPAIMNTAAWIAAFTCLVGEVYCGSRLMFGLSRERGLPSAFALISKRTRVPWFSILFMYLLGIIIIVIGSIAVFENFYVELCMMGCEAGMICWLILLVAAVKYKKMFPAEWEALGWHLPGRSVLIPLAFLCSAFLLWGLFSGDPLSILYIAIFAGLMGLAYFAYAKKRLTSEEYI